MYTMLLSKKRRLAEHPTTPEWLKHGKKLANEEQAAQIILLALHTPKKESTTDQFNIPEADLLATEEGIHTADRSRPENNPEKTPESRPLPDGDKMDEDQAGPDPGESRVALTGPNPEPTHKEFMANVYPNVHESLKFPTDEHVILDDPLNSELVARVIALETKFSDLEWKSKNLDNTTPNLGSRVFTLELRDLPHKIDETIRETVKEAVHMALQAPLRDRFRDLPEANMKEMLHQWMFESGSYKSHPEHVALYEALEASMERAQRDEFLAKKDKEAPSSSSKQKSISYSEQPVKDVPMPNDMCISDSEDIDTAHLPKIKARPDWLKPAPGGR
ncbi:hypothetical protein Tco_1091348 [Tanacetum coccineum]|uniref:Uncharacterized protein n=1 Tax=Tanacetum coccineum TaxID=301880 RepID=A0ABQ5I6Y4_9ASTR